MESPVPKRKRSKGGEYRAIYSVIVDDVYFQELSSRARVLFYTLKLTLGRLGIQVQYAEPLTAQSGLTAEELEAAAGELEQAGWLRRERNIWWLVDGLAYDPHVHPSNTNHLKWILRTANNLPRLEIVKDFMLYYGLEVTPADLGGESPASDTVIKGIGDGIPHALPDGIPDHKTSTDTATTTGSVSFANAQETGASAELEKPQNGRQRPTSENANDPNCEFWEIVRNQFWRPDAEPPDGYSASRERTIWDECLARGHTRDTIAKALRGAALKRDRGELGRIGKLDKITSRILLFEPDGMVTDPIFTFEAYWDKHGGDPPVQLKRRNADLSRLTVSIPEGAGG